MPFGHADWLLDADPLPYSAAPLSPLVDPAHLSYYFDFYDWRDETRASGLDAGGRVKVLQITTGTTTNFLISGPSGCGRSSLENLLLYEISQVPPGSPLVVRLKMAVGDQDKATRGTMLVQNVQRAVLRRPDPATAAVLMATFQNWQALTPAGVQPDVTNLLAQLREDIQDGLPDVLIVVVLDALNHTISRDAALDAVEMVQDFADIAILSVTVPDHASYVRSRFSLRQKPVAWINAPRVEAAAFSQYVEKRVGAERPPGAAPPTSLHPFTLQAIERVFARTDGSGAAPLPMRVAIQKLSAALRYKQAALGTAPPPPPEVTEYDVQQSFG